MIPTFTYETSCRKCKEQFTQELKSVDPISKHGFIIIMQGYLEVPPLMRCPRCDMDTVHEIISYKA